MEPLYIPVLLGTGRQERRSEHVAKFVVEQLKASGIKTELLDVRDIALSSTVAPWMPSVAATAKWQSAMAAADGLFVVSPEYNRGYPGELKLAIDALGKEYRRKPVAIAGVSSGVFGGRAVILALRQVLTYLGMVPTSMELNVGPVDDVFGADGALLDPAFTERSKKVIDELVWLANALKAARE